MHWAPLSEGSAVCRFRVVSGLWISAAMQPVTALISNVMTLFLPLPHRNNILLHLLMLDFVWLLLVWIWILPLPHRSNTPLLHRTRAWP